MVNLFGQILGFLGTRASIMLDVVFVAMFLVLPVLAVSIGCVRKGNYRMHKRLQLALGAVLLLAVVAFELDMRFSTDWRALAAASPYYQREGWSPVWVSLCVHLSFAIPAAVLWTYVIVQAVRKFSRPPAPGAHSVSHKFWGWLAVISITMTAITGWIFYYLAFVAT